MRGVKGVVWRSAIAKIDSTRIYRGVPISVETGAASCLVCIRPSAVLSIRICSRKTRPSPLPLCYCPFVQRLSSTPCTRVGVGMIGKAGVIDVLKILMEFLQYQSRVFMAPTCSVRPRVGQMILVVENAV